jgi:F-type H+-transporting ATPase subunit delta
MSARGAATRYARALLDVTTKQGGPDQAERDLDAVVGLMNRHADLHRSLTNPAVPAAGKRGVVQALAVRLDLSTPVTRLLVMLAERDRLLLLPDLLSVYRERLMDHQQVVRAEVTTAVPLAQDLASRLEHRLAEVTGRRVSMTTKVDPSIIGGVVTKIGSTVYDGSLARQLATIRRKLVGQA